MEPKKKGGSAMRAGLLVVILAVLGGVFYFTRMMGPPPAEEIPIAIASGDYFGLTLVELGKKVGAKAPPEKVFDRNYVFDLSHIEGLKPTKLQVFILGGDEATGKVNQVKLVETPDPWK